MALQLLPLLMMLLPLLRQLPRLWQRMLLTRLLFVQMVPCWGGGQIGCRVVWSEAGGESSLEDCHGEAVLVFCAAFFFLCTAMTETPGMLMCVNDTVCLFYLCGEPAQTRLICRRLRNQNTRLSSTTLDPSTVSIFSTILNQPPAKHIIYQARVQSTRIQQKKQIGNQNVL